MKKLLASIASVSLLTTPVVNVVSCTWGDPNKKVELDLWDSQRYAEELSDLKYEIIENGESENQSYKLTSEKVGLNFTIKEQKRSGKRYELSNKSIRIDNVDINNYSDSDAVDYFAAFSVVESELPDSDDLYDDKYEETFSKRTLGLVEAELIDAEGVPQTENPLFKKNFYFAFGEVSVDWYIQNTLSHAESYFSKEEKRYIYQEPKPIEELQEMLWEEVITRSLDLMTNNEKQRQEIKSHFEKYLTIEMDKTYDPFDWKGNENRDWFQVLENHLVYSFNKKTFEVRWDLYVKTNQKELNNSKK
ncbi:lipoprotein [Spiroplasma endosymbiont of Panorpa germanica]|uniref:lipoprotein n=1 Tax=Spiroplasma endosymbiont of Panorpa germanica TaxID=3066314 RepID=UPI0030D110D0